MTPAPIYTFLVNNIDYEIIYSQPLPSSIENVIGNLNEQAVYVPYINKPLKNGDAFTLYGKRAQIVYDMFIGKRPKILELLATTDHIPTLITKDLEFDKVSLPIKSAISSSYKATIINRSSREAFFVAKAFDSNGDSINISLSSNGSLDPSSPSESFSVSVVGGAILELKLQASEKFYFTYNELTF
jgi:hypothetical protein